MELLQSESYRYVSLTIADIFLVLVIMTIAFIVSHLYSRRKIGEFAFYRFFTAGLMVRMLGTIGFCLVYLLFYQGDTLDYFNSAATLNQLVFRNPDHYFTILFNGAKPDYYYFFNSDTGFPIWHIWKDPMSFYVVRLIAPVCLIGLNSFFVSSILMAIITYAGMWKLYRLLCTLYPRIYKYFMFSVLMVPSVIFWGSGLLKDSITITAAAWLTYCIFAIIFMKKKILVNLLVSAVMIFLLLQIKPYIFISLVPGLLIWVFIRYTMRIKNVVLKVLITPTAILLALAGSVMVISSMSGTLGIYSDVETIIEKVKITQEDLIREEQYGENYFNIGKIEGTPMGLISKAPAAIVAGLFRPMIWEARNPFIVISALENLFLLLLLIFTFFRLGPVRYIRAVFSDPFLTFSLFFSVIFAFGVGLASANFGALVRYKIPLLPFFVSGMFIMLNIYREQKAQSASKDSMQRKGRRIRGY